MPAFSDCASVDVSGDGTACMTPNSETWSSGCCWVADLLMERESDLRKPMTRGRMAADSQGTLPLDEPTLQYSCHTVVI
jgi:hypothetical protein